MDVFEADEVGGGLGEARHAVADGGPLLDAKVHVLHDDLDEAEVVLVCLAGHELDELDDLVRPLQHEMEIAAEGHHVVLHDLLESLVKVLLQQPQPGYDGLA